VNKHNNNYRIYVQIKIIETKSGNKMKKNSITCLIIILLAVFISTPGIVFTQTDNIEITKIKNNFYRLTSKIPYKSNFLAYVTKEGILLVDAGQKQTGNELRAALKKIADGNSTVKYLINTHAHIDHTGGNLALAGEPVIIGPEILRSTLRDYSYVVYEFPDNAVPSITFKDSMNVYFGNEIIRLISIPGSHDQTDIIVHFTKAGIVCMGDVSYGMSFPSIDAYTGNLLKYPEVLGYVLTLIPDTAIIVSGHGRESSVSELKQYKNMIENTSRIVKEESAKGKSIEEMQKEDILKDYASFDSEELLKRSDWIFSLAKAGPPLYKNSLIKELYYVLIKNDVDKAIEKYNQLKRDSPKDYPFEASQLTRIGQWLIGKGRIKEAIKLLELGVNEYPKSAGAFYNLAEAYLGNGSRELAIKNYEKCLEINPKYTNAIEKLKKLKD
jgi:cyclase